MHNGGLKKPETMTYKEKIIAKSFAAPGYFKSKQR